MKLLRYLILIIVISFLLSFNTVRFFPIDEIGLLITIIGLIYGLMAAFIINHTWERFSKIRDSIAEETSSLKNLHSILKNHSDKSILREYSNKIVEYCKDVITTEWRDYWSKENAHRKFDEIFDLVSDMKIKSRKDELICTQCFEELRQASTARTHQLVLAKTGLSGLQWTLLIFLSFILSVSIIFLAIPISAVSMFITTCMLTAIILILFVIYELNSMKFAENEVSEGPYKELIQKLGEMDERAPPHL